MFREKLVANSDAVQYTRRPGLETNSTRLISGSLDTYNGVTRIRNFCVAPQVSIRKDEIQLCFNKSSVIRIFSVEKGIKKEATFLFKEELNRTVKSASKLII